MLVFIYCILIYVSVYLADLTFHCDCQAGHPRISTGCIAHGQRFVPKNLDCTSYLICVHNFIFEITLIYW